MPQKKIAEPEEDSLSDQEIQQLRNEILAEVYFQQRGQITPPGQLPLTVKPPQAPLPDPTQFFRDIGSVQREVDPIGISPMPLNVTIPKGARAAEILAEKIPAIFGREVGATPQWIEKTGEYTVRAPRAASFGGRAIPLELHRWQEEAPGQPETLRRGGQYFLHDTESGDISGVYQAGGPTPPIEGGRYLRRVTAEVKNPLLVMEPAYNTRILQKLMGERSLTGKSYWEDTGKSLEELALKVGVSRKTLALARTASDPSEALKDVIKNQILKNAGYDAVIRRRGFTGERTPEVFLTDPRTQIK